MPTYQYACTACDHRFDAVQAFSDDALTACPACEGRLRKVFSSVGIVFKGSGFYRTDSRAGAVNGSESGKAESTSDSGKSESGSSDSGKSESGTSTSGKSDSGSAGSGKSDSGSSSSGSSSSGSSSSGSSSSGSGSSGASTPAKSAAGT